MEKPIQPGLLRTFRYFTGVAMGYYAVLVFFATFQIGEGSRPALMQLYLNLWTNTALSVYLSWNWLQRKLRGWYLPIALLAATIVPIFSNLLYLVDPGVKNLSLMVARSWLLFPILLVPLVLIAWQYDMRLVLAFTVLTAIVELAALYPVLGQISYDTLPMLGLPLIRAFAFGIVGHIVTHLIETQQAQSKALLRANEKLIRHAETLEQLAVSRERNRLARELHDTLAHTLSGQAVNLEAIKLMITPEQTEVHEMLDQALESTRSGLRETRRALKDLRSLPLQDLGLALAIRNLARDAESRAGFELELEINEPLPTFPPDAEQSIFRIAQESLENIVRHASASRVKLHLGVEQGRLQMTIQDDGVGVDLENLNMDDRLGLQGMQERAAETNAAFEVYSQPRQGMLIRLSIEAQNDQSIDL